MQPCKLNADGRMLQSFAQFMVFMVQQSLQKMPHLTLLRLGLPLLLLVLLELLLENCHAGPLPLKLNLLLFLQGPFVHPQRLQNAPMQCPLRTMCVIVPKGCN